MINAVNELRKHGYQFADNIKEMIISSETKIINQKLYYKNIPEGLLLLTYYSVNNEHISFTNNFKTFGTMIDLSRGAVFNVNYIKELIRKKAMMGVNEIWLYMEDVYELEKYPIFGYNRGKYTKKELIEIVKYSKIFGVKLIPTIQTLGHMEQFLSWYQTSKYKDQSNVLLVGLDETYELINEMFSVLYSIFETTKIHVGLDETFGFGFGNYYKKNGYQRPINVFLEHLNKVNDLAIKNGFKDILIWSDMFFRFHSKTNYYYDTEIEFTKEIISKIPENVKLVYWDYYNNNLDKITKMLENHLKLSRNIIFASGTWIWTRFTYDKKKTDDTAMKHLDAAIKKNIDEFILTQWMDDGAYGNHITTLLGVFELSVKANIKNQKSNDVYKFIVKEEYDDSLLRTKLNDTKFSQVGVLWDEILFSPYLNNQTGNEINKYLDLIKEQRKLVNLYKNKDLFDFEYTIASINFYKIKAKYKFLQAYLNNERINVKNEYKKMIFHLKRLNNIYRSFWYKRYKLNGFEIIQSRLATQIIRANEMIEIARQYNDGIIKEIPELSNDVAIKNDVVFEKYSNIAYTTKPF
ncbi:family 20 glycosylhydrolase [Haploplasma axanthum]|uniref:N-acetyl-beta-hexosaminidase n=1 Tax=Haploplasma axanthum TaxID=29552 RepID=A0A449BD17_HAPAX|nr:family 20 glycosylhydrolase [Haploplasma axanthum]VEU80312.1 N-acetyl-beta-hexosaminidase [Haploplasma axanthum]